ncbi:MAG: hypothetical protein VX528_04080 [Candidatus Latescibacterota bacterium]|nr:hypothetical protein [Candidatus Latescibacterota bacterium]
MRLTFVQATAIIGAVGFLLLGVLHMAVTWIGGSWGSGGRLLHDGLFALHLISLAVLLWDFPYPNSARVSGSPMCAVCRYPAAGVGAERCPECGADLQAPLGLLVGPPTRKSVWSARILVVIVLLLAANEVSSSF